MQKTAVRSIDENPSETIDRDLKGNGAEKLLADTQALARGIAMRAAEIEQQRRVPWDIFDSLRACGLFKTLVPRSHGGLGLSVPEILPVITALSAADGSVGWIAMLAASSQMFCSRLVPRHRAGGSCDRAASGERDHRGLARSRAGAEPSAPA
jgi:alkylation response protein AidB-like acyl-CoA dehydrogenase